jgi:hypothetical protein
VIIDDKQALRSGSSLIDKGRKKIALVTVDYVSVGNLDGRVYQSIG